MFTLNNRNELISGCRFSKKFLLNTVLTWLNFYYKIKTNYSPPAYLDVTRKNPSRKTLVKLNFTIASALKLFLRRQNKSNIYISDIDLRFCFIHQVLCSYVVLPHNWSIRTSSKKGKDAGHDKVGTGSCRQRAPFIYSYFEKGCRKNCACDNPKR